MSDAAMRDGTAHEGVCESPDEALARLFAAYVGA